MGVLYATREDVYRHGVPRGTLVQPARPIASVDTTADTLECEAHGLSVDDPIQFLVDAGGTIAAPLTTSAVYYAKPVTDSESLFQVAATPGGSAIDLTTPGANFSLVVAIGPQIDGWVEYASRLADKAAIAHKVPFDGPFPKVIVVCVARIAAFEMLSSIGLSQPPVEASALRSFAILKELSEGVPLNDSAAFPDMDDIAFGKGRGSRHEEIL